MAGSFKVMQKIDRLKRIDFWWAHSAKGWSICGTKRIMVFVIPYNWMFYWQNMKKMLGLIVSISKRHKFAILKHCACITYIQIVATIWSYGKCIY